MYYSQEIIGLLCVLGCEGGCYCDIIGVAVLIKVSTIVAVGKIVTAVVGLVVGADLRCVRKYHPVAGT
jgi:hypothetical protein